MKQKQKQNKKKKKKQLKAPLELLWGCKRRKETVTKHRTKKNWNKRRIQVHMEIKNSFFAAARIVSIAGRKERKEEEGNNLRSERVHPD